MPLRIHIVDYDPRWPDRFAMESGRIKAALGWRALRIEHVGSTSVEGLAAKPVVDILLAVPDSADEPAYASALEEAGYELTIREPEWHEHRMLQGIEPAVNLHVFTLGCPEIDRMLLFRDWLRTNTEDRELYARAKRELAREEWERVQDYADAKTAVIARIIARATSQGA